MDSDNGATQSEDVEAETVIAIQYDIPIMDILSATEDECHKEKYVRLMSLEFPIMPTVTSSTTFEEYVSPCPLYTEFYSFAETFIDDIIEEAEGLINQHIEQIPTMPKSISKERIVRRYSEDSYPIIECNRPEFTRWPTIEEFTIELGADKIDEYLASFNTNEEWLYIIYYLGTNGDYACKSYEYQAMWSLPSPEYPIAQATASVFFTMEVSEVIPKECPVKVTFTFESHRFKHTPGLTDFNEEFLNYVLDSKIGVFSKIYF